MEWIWVPNITAVKVRNSRASKHRKIRSMTATGGEKSLHSTQHRDKHTHQILLTQRTLEFPWTQMHPCRRQHWHVLLNVMFDLCEMSLWRINVRLPTVPLDFNTGDEVETAETERMQRNRGYVHLKKKDITCHKIQKSTHQNAQRLVSI